MDASEKSGEGINGEYDDENEEDAEDDDEMCNLDNQDDEDKKVVNSMTLHHKR